MKICAVGCGNVGFNTLKAFNVRGHYVFGVDTSEAALQRVGHSFGAQAVIDRLDDLGGMDIVFVCVPTDPDELTGRGPRNHEGGHPRLLCSGVRLDVAA
ncbi:hypothetical protein [Actinomadura sp. KC06]|uniref:hypothetical protein n=1 Tax=Actinomadura sp. KC06 TaxID=2530369 RepID=UPI001404FD23|nr:hypothetical protein [Actinomadura sp. KC06]